MNLAQELRHGARTLRKSPGSTSIAVMTLALGIGMATAIFTVVYGVLLRPLSFDHPEQIVQLHELSARGNPMQFADPNFADVRGQSKSLQGVAEYAAVPEAVAGGEEPTRTTAAWVSKDFFPVLRVSPIVGRGFAPEEQRYGAAPVALVSYGFWQQFLGGTKDLASKKLTIDNQSVSIIGVLPKRFDFPEGAQIWTPRELQEDLPSRTAHNWHVIARLRDGVSVSEAKAELQTIATRLKQQYGQDTGMVGVAIAPLREAMTSDVRPALWILLGAVGLLLLIACANVANLLLVQATARQQELAIRLALGASQSRLLVSSLAETLLLTLLGGFFGVLTAFWAVKALLAFSPDALPRTSEVSIGVPVLAFSFALCLLVAFALGTFTALRSRGDIQPALVAGGRSQTNGRASQQTSRTIVAAQLAITLTLVTSAALLGRSLLHVLSVNTGFRTQHVITMDLSLPDAAQGDAKARRVQLMDELFARVSRIPGTQQVGGTSNLPLTGFHPDGTYVLMSQGEALPSNMRDLEQLFHDKSRTGDAQYAAATEGYFAALGIPLLRGRLFNSADTIDTPPVAIISDSLAREKWPGQDPLGRMIEFGNMDGDLRMLTVVGVVGDVREERLERPASPAIYVDARQRPQSTSAFNVVVRTEADPATVTASLRQIVRELDPSVPPKFATLDQVVSGSVQGRRFNLLVIGVFAGTALLLAIAGMYGVMAYSVARRTSEIGVRMALGATQASILQLVLGQGLLTGALGVVAGMAASLAATRVMKSMLFGLSATDPVTFGGVAFLLVLVALLATYLPARRAARMNPMVALRKE